MWIHLGVAAVLALIGVSLLLEGHPLDTRLAKTPLRKVSELSEGMEVRLVGRLVAGSTLRTPLANKDAVLYQLEALGIPDLQHRAGPRTTELQQLYQTTDWSDGLCLADGTGEIILNPMKGESSTATQSSRATVALHADEFPPDGARGR